MHGQRPPFWLSSSPTALRFSLGRRENRGIGDQVGKPLLTGRRPKGGGEAWDPERALLAPLVSALETLPLPPGCSIDSSCQRDEAHFRPQRCHCSCPACPRWLAGRLNAWTMSLCNEVDTVSGDVLASIVPQRTAQKCGAANHHHVPTTGLVSRAKESLPEHMNMKVAMGEYATKAVVSQMPNNKIKNENM